MKLTYKQIEGIRKRSESATPGPWVWVGPDTKDDSDTNMGWIEAPNKTKEVVCDFGDCEQFYPTEGEPFKENDLDFVINARQDIPALLAHIAELEQLLKSSRSGERMWRDLRLEASERIREMETELEEWNRYKQLEENAKFLRKLISEKE